MTTHVRLHDDDNTSATLTAQQQARNESICSVCEQFTHFESLDASGRCDDCRP